MCNMIQSTFEREDDRSLENALKCFKGGRWAHIAKHYALRGSLFEGV